MEDPTPVPNMEEVILPKNGKTRPNYKHIQIVRKLKIKNKILLCSEPEERQ